MTPVLQDLVVFAIVVAAMVSAVVRFMPKAWRTKLASRVARWSTGLGLPASAARRIEAELASGGACGSCDSCRACATPAAVVDEVPTHQIIPIVRARS